MSLISLDNVIKEIEHVQTRNQDILDTIDDINSIVEAYALTEAEYNKVTPHLKLEILDIEKFVRINECKCVTDPRPFDSNNIPNRNGLLSNEIFGFTSEERSGIFGYIDLHGWFMDPSCYKTWIRLDSKVKNIIHGIGYWRIDEDGHFVEDPSGETGIDWIRKNLNKISFKQPMTKSKDISYQYLNMNKDHIFIQKYLVIPPFYRDKNTSQNSRVVGLGGVNKLYTNLIVSANALTATQDYNFDSSDAMKARVQEQILNIYDWFCGNNNKAVENSVGLSMGSGMSGKIGIMRRTATSKTTNFASRLVISAPELKVEKPEDMEVTFDKTAVPLFALLTEFRDFVMFHTRRFFENEFMGVQSYPVLDKNGNPKTIIPESPEIVFSDERIKREMDRFLHGYNNRFVPIEVPVEGSDEFYYMAFKGRGIAPGDQPNDPKYNRRLTWCDVFYIATVEATKNKQLLQVRFPMV
ncbi:MAG: hypothetical protein IKR19_08235 [Acholeplasmatales bacterium]|nr:hypothetical protein [Acholeplasmatales bacterium]